MGTTRSRASSSLTSTSARVNSRSIVFIPIKSYGWLPTLVTTWKTLGLCRARTRAQSVQADSVFEFLEEALRHLLGLARQPSHLAQQRLLLGRQILGHDHLHDHELVAAPPASD